MNQKHLVTAPSSIEDVLQRLARIVTVNGKHFSWSAAKLDSATFDLISKLKFNDRFKDHTKDHAIWIALNKCAEAKNFTSKKFIHELRKFLSSHCNRPQREHMAVTKFNFGVRGDRSVTLPSRYSTIELKHSIASGQYLPVQNSSQFKDGELGQNRNFTFAISHVIATDSRDALEIGYVNFKFLLGVLNIVCRGYGITKRFGMPNTPIGRLLTAAEVIVHDIQSGESGSHAQDSSFPSRHKSHFSVNHDFDWKKIKKSVGLYTDGLRRTDFGDKITDAVVLLQEALEAQEVYIVLLKSWTGIEILCSKEEKETSEKIVARASSIFEDSEQVGARLGFIQQSRNNLVHRGAFGDHANLCAQWAIMYLAEIILFCLFNRHSLREHRQILDYMLIEKDAMKIRSVISLHQKKVKSLKGSTQQGV